VVGTVLALQLTSGNVDAATKGYLVKLKKAKILASVDLSATLTKLPHTEEQFDMLSSKYRTDFPGMKGSLDSSNDLWCFAMQSLGPDACVFEHDDGFLISNSMTGSCECFRDDIFVPEHVMQQCLLIADRALTVKFLNITLVVEAVGALVKTSASNVLLTSDDLHPLVALTLVLDVNALLSLDVLNAPEVLFFLRSANDGPFESRDVVVSKKNDNIHWYNTKQMYATDTDAAQITFTLNATTQNGPEDAPAATGQVSVGCSGAYKTLSVFLT
jgi:hypothetical protein